MTHRTYVRTTGNGYEAFCQGCTWVGRQATTKTLAIEEGQGHERAWRIIDTEAT